MTGGCGDGETFFMPRAIRTAILLMSLSACTSPRDWYSAIDNPKLARLARQAMAEDNTSISTGFIHDRETGSLRDVIRDASIILVTSTGTSRGYVFNDA